MSRSKTLIRYQQGYCGQPTDIEALKPREARAYCLGVGHVAAGTLPLGSGGEVLAALATRRRDVSGGGSMVVAAAAASVEVGAVTTAPKRFYSVGDLVRVRCNVWGLGLDQVYKIDEIDWVDHLILVNGVWLTLDDIEHAPIQKDASP